MASSPLQRRPRVPRAAQTQLSNLSNAFTKGLANMMQAIGQSNIVGAIKGIKSIVDGAFKGATEFVSGFVKTFDPSALINSLSVLGDAFMDGFGPVPDATNSGKDLGKMATSLAKKLKDSLRYSTHSGRS